MFHEKRLPILATYLIGMLKGYLFSNGRHTKGGGGGTFYVKNSIYEGKELDLGAGPAHLKLCWVTPPRDLCKDETRPVSE